MSAEKETDSIVLGSKEQFQKIVEVMTKPKPPGFGGQCQVDYSPVKEKYHDPITAQFFKFKPRQFCPAPVFMAVPDYIDMSQPAVPKRVVVQPLFDTDDDEDVPHDVGDDDEWFH